MNPLVDPHWLAARLKDSNTVVLDATMPPVGVTPPLDTRARYATRHIPGAIFFDIDELSDSTSGLPHTLLQPDAFAPAMSALGVSDTSTIVIYEQAGVYSAPRAWWMLRTMGAVDVRVLDGGLDAWTAAGFPTEATAVTRPTTNFTAHFDADAVVDYPRLTQLLSKHAQILDARSNPRFTGAAPEPRPGISSGHMPGSISVPFTELAENGRLKSPEALRALFATKGVDISRPITTTCGSGVTAAVISLALELAGAEDVTLYDGSWAEYAQQPDAVILKD